MPDLTLDDLGQAAPAIVVVLHNNMIKALRAAYPAWKDYWYITINVGENNCGGIVQVRNMAISDKMGIQMPITQVSTRSGLKELVTMAGELLERYNIARKKGIDIKQAIADVKRNGIGPIHET